MTYDSLQQLLVRVGARSCEFIDFLGLQGIEYARDRLSDIFHISGLQPGPASAKDGQNGRFASQFAQRRQKRVAGAEHNGGAEKKPRGGRGLHEFFAFSPALGVW